jgi:hypothetical protein
MRHYLYTFGVRFDALDDVEARGMALRLSQLLAPVAPALDLTSSEKLQRLSDNGPPRNVPLTIPREYQES